MEGGAMRGLFTAGITDVFMETGFSGGERHVRRIKGIEEYDR